MDYMHIFGVAGHVLLVALLVGLVIFVHELGHFLAARRLGMVVDAFSLGFGPILWKRKIGTVEYRISLIPLGGYVIIPQLDPSGMDTIQGKGDETEKTTGSSRRLPPAAPWKKIIVAVAGPVGNVTLAVIMAWWIYLTPHPVSGTSGTTIGSVETNSPSWAAGLRPGQVIESVNGQRVVTWYDFMVECHLAGDSTHGVALTVQDGNRAHTVQIPLTIHDEEGAQLGVVAGLSPSSRCRVGNVMSNGAAAANGIMAGDTIETINGMHIFSREQFVDAVTTNGTNPVVITLTRNAQLMTFSLVPRLDATLGRALIGVVLEDTSTPPWMQYTKPWRQIKGDAGAVFRLLKALVFPAHKGEAARAANSVGGMPTIVVVLWMAVKNGLLSTLGLLRMIGINLAILNLLPIPVLDGGHVIFALGELVFRRSFNPKIIGVVVNFFAALLIALMLLLVVRDPQVRRFWPHGHGQTQITSTNETQKATHTPAQGSNP